MSRTSISAANSVNNALATNALLNKELDFKVNDGIEGQHTVELRMNLSKKASKSEGTVFTFHAGRLCKSNKGDFFFSFSPLDPYKKGQLNFNKEGGLTYNPIWAKLVSKGEVPAAALPMVKMLKEMKAAEAHSALAMMALTSPEQAELLQGYLSDGELKYQDINLEKLFVKVFGHANIKIHSTVNNFQDAIENIQDTLAQADRGHTLVLRFSLVDAINAASELKELPNAFYPNGTPVYIKQVYVNMTYVGIEEGTVYQADTSKYVAPAIMRDAIAEALVSKAAEPVYINMAKLQAEANQVNAWKQKIEAATGNKWLMKLGYTAKKGEVSKFFLLDKDSKEFADMSAALLEAAVSGTKDLTLARAQNIIAAAKAYVPEVVVINEVVAQSTLVETADELVLMSDEELNAILSI